MKMLPPADRRSGVTELEAYLDRRELASGPPHVAQPRHIERWRLNAAGWTLIGLAAALLILVGVIGGLVFGRDAPGAAEERLVATIELMTDEIKAEREERRRVERAAAQERRHNTNLLMGAIIAVIFIGICAAYGKTPGALFGLVIVLLVAGFATGAIKI